MVRKAREALHKAALVFSSSDNARMYIWSRAKQGTRSQSVSPGVTPEEVSETEKERVH